MLANLGPLGSPSVQILMWLACAGIEAVLVERCLRDRGLPRLRVQEAALLVNLLSWPPFLLALGATERLGISFALRFAMFELLVVLFEAVGLRVAIRSMLRREPTEKLPGVRPLLPISLLANATTIACWLLLLQFD